MDWLDNKEQYIDEHVAIVPVTPGRNPRIGYANARVLVRDGVASLQVLFCDEYDDENDYVWHTVDYAFTDEEIDYINKEVRI